MSRRATIVSAATELFARQGYKATSVADISLAVGLSPSAGGLYRHFGSKEALLDAVVDLALEHVHAAEGLRLKMAEREVHLDAEVEARLGGQHLLEQLRANRGLLQIMDRDLVDHPRLLDRVHAELVEPVMAGLTDWIGDLGITDRRAELDVTALASVMWGALYARAMFQTSTVSDEQAIDVWATALLGALKAPSNAQRQSVDA